MLKLNQETLSSLILEAEKRYAGKKAFSVIGEDGERDELSYADFGKRSRLFAGSLAALGVEAGDRVLIIAENRPEWAISYFGIALAGAVTVPVLTDFLSEHIASVVKHAEPKALCATAKTLPKLREAGIDPALPIIRLDKMDEHSVLVESSGERRGLSFSASLARSVGEDDLASIIYTSGTSGNSKGVMLSHKNIVFDAAACRSIIKIFPRDRFLSVLPLAHSYECTIGLVIGVLNGASTAYLDRPPSPAALLPALKLVKPTMMLTVPLIMEKIYRSKIAPALESNRLASNPLTRGLILRIAGGKLLGTFGGAIRFFGVGGAALAPDVEAFLKAAGFPYAIGYGLTETAPLLAGAPPFKTVLRSTGPALKGVELRIVDNEGHIVGGVGATGDKSGLEGEIQARGPNVMLGYYKDPERTKEVFTHDGWFKTGDLGCFDAAGRLFIRGRLKAMILGSSGENIYPEEIESVLNATGFVEESLVYEGEKGELVALVVLNEKAKTLIAAAGDAAQSAAHNAVEAAAHAAKAVGDAAKALGDTAKNVGDSAAAKSGELLSELKAMVNKRLTSFSRLHKMEAHNEPFEKTATMKIKRFLYPKKKKS